MAVQAKTQIPLGASIATFLRSFAIQGSWNYRTMIGQGFAFALLPVLQHVHRGDPTALARAVERHAHQFNAHPYMAELALGAVARMEADGAHPEAIERFKVAVRGPLGSIGDRLIWVGALPTAALVGLVTLAAGAPVWLPPVVFLLVYNAVHLTLRIWAFRAGLQKGAEVAAQLNAARLPRLADQLGSGGIFLIGGLAGLLGVRSMGAGDGGWPLVFLIVAAGALVLGERIGNDAWRFAALAAAILVFGILGAEILS